MLTLRGTNSLLPNQPPGRAEQDREAVTRRGIVRAAAGLGRRERTRGDIDPPGSSWSLSLRGVRANPTPEPRTSPAAAAAPGDPLLEALYALCVSRKPVPLPLIDAHARRVRDLRISITDR